MNLDDLANLSRIIASIGSLLILAISVQAQHYNNDWIKHKSMYQYFKHSEFALVINENFETDIRRWGC